MFLYRDGFTCFCMDSFVNLTAKSLAKLVFFIEAILPDIYWVAWLFFVELCLLVDNTPLAG